MLKLNYADDGIGWFIDKNNEIYALLEYKWNNF